MKVNYEKGEVSFDLHSILEHISKEQKLDMMESFACDDHIIKHVTDQILDRWTENMCSGGCAITADVFPTNGLDWAWREVAKRSGEVAAREIERLEKALETQKKRTAEAWGDAMKWKSHYERCQG